MAENGVIIAKSKTQWVQPSEQIARAPVVEAQKEKRQTEVDSLESLNEKTIASNMKKQENSAGFWATVWSKICSLFGYSTAATTEAGQGSSAKPGGDGAQAIGGSPSLQAPYMFDLVEFTKLLKETRDSLTQVQETNNEAEEDARKSEESKKHLIEYLKTLSKIHEEGARLIKVEFIRHQEGQRDVRKKLGDTKTEAAEAASNERYWGWWNGVANWTLAGATVIFVAGAALAAAGTSIPAGIAAGVAAFSGIAMPVTGAFTGITSIMKGAMLQQTRR